jgi:hypothetical protein
MNTPPTTLRTTDRGISVGNHEVAVGDYVWHRGAFRRVTAREGWATLRMGRYVSHWHGEYEWLPGWVGGAEAAEAVAA